MRRDLATTAILIALAVALGILLAPIPNVEAISAVSFFSGFILGWLRGGLIGGTAMLLLSLLNPLGPAPPPVFACQVIGMALIGASGCLLRANGVPRPRFRMLALISGAGMTLIYDILTNYGVAVSIGKWQDPWVVMVAGLPFSAIHVVTNAIMFGAVGALVARKSWPVVSRKS
jgi:hypothetical protein